jgi:peptidoglycan-associated lipoprotein
MNTELGNGSIALFLCAVLATGCATETVKKTEVPTGQSASASTGAPATARSAPNSNPSQAGSSLDALREGKPPASGPLKDIYFEFDSSALSAQARSVLQTNAGWLKANPAAQVEIEGHCDERGTTEYNLALGAKRARGAMDYLVSLGIAASRIKTVSYGEELPLCKEKSEDCYRNNRRDRFVEARARPGA